jgi:hypothetical protein
MTSEIPVWAEELAKTLPSVVTAITAIYGVGIAKAGLDKWHVETIGKRKAELAEQALTAFYEARDVFVWVRTPAGFNGEGGSRRPADGESETQQEKRNTYFIPIERLTREKQLFARLQSLRYSFAAQFGEAASEPFIAIWSVHNDIHTSASVLIQITPDDDDNSRDFAKSAEPLLNKMGWGPGPRPDDIDRKIEKAIQDIETVCRPVLAGAPTK